MQPPLVSVIMPSYNHAKYIRDAIDSVLRQTFPNFELIISDDGSTDGSAEIIQAYSDKRIKANFFSVNMGQKNNVDYCIKNATGKYVAFLPSDDIWMPEKLERQLQAMDANPAIGALFSFVNIIDDDGNIIPETDHFLYEFFNNPYTTAELVYQFFFGGNCLAAMTCFVKRELIAPIILTGNFVRQLGDFEYWIGLIKKAPIYVMDERLACHRIRSDQGNMSAINEKSLLRTGNEAALLLYDFFDDMPIDLFMDSFSDLLIKLRPLSEHELKCEQAFLYIKNKKQLGANGMRIAAEKIYRLARDPDTLSVLQNTYGFNQRAFNDLTIRYLCYHYVNITKSKFEDKFGELLKTLPSWERKTAIYCPDGDFTTRLITFLLDNDAACLRYIVCLISGMPEKNAAKKYRDIPIVSLEDAQSYYGVNAIIIASYKHQNYLYESIRHCEDNGVQLIQLFSAADVLLECYE